MSDSDENFDLENPQPIQLPMWDFCNQLIHHYVLFAMRGEDRRFEAVYVFSDYKRNVCLYEFSMDHVLSAYQVFASEDSAPYSGEGYRFEWNEKRQDYVWAHVPAQASAGAPAA